MDEVNSTVNFNVNENRPILDNHDVNSNSILNGSAKNEFSVLEPIACFQSSLEIDKQTAGVNNNGQNEDPNSSFTLTECSITGIKNNSEERVLLNSEGKTKADSNVSFTPVSNNEVSDNLSANLNSGEIPVGSINFLPADLSAKIYNNNPINNTTGCNESSMSEGEHITSFSICDEELKDEKKNSYLVAQDLVDFSFREQGSIANDLIGTGTDVDSVSKYSETFINSTLEKTSDIPVTNKKEDKPLGTSEKLFETDGAIQVPKESTDSHENSVTTDTVENIAALLGSMNINSPLSVYENPPASNIVSDNTSVEIEKTAKVSDNMSLEPEKPTKVADNASLKPENPSKVAEDVSVVLTDSVCRDEASFQVFGDGSNEFSPLKMEVADNAPLEPENPSKVAADVSFALTDNVCRDDASFQVFGDVSNEFSPLKMEKVSFGMSDKSFDKFADLDFLCENPSKGADELSPLKVGKVSFDLSDKPLEQFPNPNLVLNPPEITNIEQCEFSPKQGEISSIKMSEKPVGQFSSSDSAFNPAEDPTEQDKFPALKPGKVSFCMTDKPLELSSNPDFAFKVPEVPSNSLGLCENADFAFKMPEKPLANDSDEQFVDAVQFFRDPNSLQFLENIRTSTVQPGSAVPRSSLYVNFDPLHSKTQIIASRADNCELISAALQESNAAVKFGSEDIVNKQLVEVSARESLGNILISFDSPKVTACVDTKRLEQTPSPPKMITEEELQQKLKIHELETQETYLKKQRETEMEIAKRDELLKYQKIIIEEFCGISFEFFEDGKVNREKIISLEEENEKLKEDLKTSAEDLQSVENTFTDFYKRYEQCKGMLKTYKDNEEHLKQTILDLQCKAKEQEQMYNMLQERTEEMLEKANVEMDSVKQSGEAQVIVLNAKLKKAEMKISSLESDIKQIKEENSQLGGICDDLMAKVSRS